MKYQGTFRWGQIYTKQFSLGFWDGRALMIDLGALACLALVPAEPAHDWEGADLLIWVASHPEIFLLHYVIAIFDK